MEGGRRINGPTKTFSPGKPLVTVVTVVRNAAAQLEKTIKSVIDQTYENIEYIIIDGASTDGSTDIIRKYDSQIDYWISEKDGGVYHGMNKAIDLARGDWINFMNAGDWFCTPDVVHSVFSRPRYPANAELLYGDYYFLYADGRKVPVKSSPLETLWQRMAFSHQGLFTRRGLMAEHKFDYKYKSASDYHFIIKSYREKKTFFYLNDFICVYSDGGITVKHQLRSMMERWKIARRFGDAAKMDIDKFHISIIFKRLPGIIKRSIRKREVEETK